MSINTICILGGTGFVGQHLATRLSNRGYTLKIPTRHPQRHRAFTVLPNTQLIQADVHDLAALKTLLKGCDAVINLVGVLHELAADTFEKVHVALPEKIIAAAQETGVARMVHVSALRADAAGPSQYLKTKARGEALLHAADGLSVTCFRPSVIFAPDDHFYNQFATLLRCLPVLPLACPDAKLAPVYVQDVVRAIEIALQNPATIGKSNDLCGPSTYTLRTIVAETAGMLGLKRCIVRMPDGLAQMQGRLFDKLPIKLFTTDNYLSLQVDSVSTNNGLMALGIAPTSVEAIMPMYFAGKTQRLSYDAFRRAARRDV